MNGISLASSHPTPYLLLCFRVLSTQTEEQKWGRHEN